MHLGFQFLPISLHYFRRTFFHYIDLCFQSVQLPKKILFQISTLTLAGLHKFPAGLMKRTLQKIPEFFLIRSLLFHRKHIRISGKCGNTDIILDPQFLTHLVQIAQIFLCQLCIVFQSHSAHCIVFIGDEHIDFAAADISLHHISDLSLKIAESFRHFDVQIQISVIDGFQFNRNLTLSGNCFCPAKAGHTFYHVILQYCLLSLSAADKYSN